MIRATVALVTGPALLALALGAPGAALPLAMIGAVFAAGLALEVATHRARVARAQLCAASSGVVLEHARLERQLVELLQVRHPSPSTRRRIADVRAQIALLEEMLMGTGGGNDAPF